MVSVADRLTSFRFARAAFHRSVDHDLDHCALSTSNVRSIMRRHIPIDYIQVIGTATIIVSLSILAYLLLSISVPS